MSKYVKSFSEILRQKEKCPVCRKPLLFEATINNISIHSVFDNLLDKTKVGFGHNASRAMPSVSGMAAENDVKRKTRKHKSLRPFSFKKEGIQVNLKNNTIIFYDNYDPNFSFFYRASCAHELLKEEYAIWGEIITGDLSLMKPGKIISLVIPIEEYSMEYEQFKLINVRVEKNQGSKITILNNFSGNGTTAFGMSEIDLTTGQGLYKEKKVDLVADDFFKFHEAGKVQARINSMFML
jgi:hypothetical protein